jgi:Bacterial extracellular solute-binding protein
VVRGVAAPGCGAQTTRSHRRLRRLSRYFPVRIGGKALPNSWSADNNESQYFDRRRDYPLLRNGSIDVTVQFVTNALVGGVPYIDLPEEVDQSDPALADWYATVSYTNPRGQNFQGAPASYGVTIPSAADNAVGAEAFVRFLLLEASLNKLERAGFLHAEVSVAGDQNDVPPPLRSLIRGGQRDDFSQWAHRDAELSVAD